MRVIGRREDDGNREHKEVVADEEIRSRDGERAVTVTRGNSPCQRELNGVLKR